MSTKLTPSQLSLKYAAAAGTAGSAALNDGDISFLAAMLDISVDNIKRGKRTPLELSVALIRAGLATPDLINNPKFNEKAIQCVADVGELSFALGAFVASAATTTATAGVAAPSVLVSGAGLLAQMFATTVACGNVAMDGAVLTIAEIEKHFKAASASTAGLISVCLNELNTKTEKHFKPENYRFTALPNIVQTELKGFLDDIRVCLFFNKCELYLLLTRKVSAATATKIAKAIILTNKYEFKQPPLNASSQLDIREIKQVAAKFMNLNLGSAFNRLIEAIRV